MSAWPSTEESPPGVLKTTRYFVEQVLRKRPYLSVAQCAAVPGAPVSQAVQADGRIRWWGRVLDSRDGTVRILRVVTLEDGATRLHAFFDRGYREDQP